MPVKYYSPAYVAASAFIWAAALRLAAGALCTIVRTWRRKRPPGAAHRHE
jgi:hypothetical protein